MERLFVNMQKYTYMQVKSILSICTLEGAEGPERNIIRST